MKAHELSRRYWEREVLPALRRLASGLEERIAAGMLGFGSDAAGLDDEWSHDHHWGPRVNLVVAEEDAGRAEELQARLRRDLPEEFEGFPVHHVDVNRCGITVESVDRFFEQVLGVAHPPGDLVGWTVLCEADLFHAVSGIVFADPPGVFSRRRDAFAYYPDPVWRKKIADWLVLLSSHGPYNLQRCAARGDEVGACLYLGETVKKLMEIGFLLNRRYAPYNKWLHRCFSALPRLALEVDPLLDRACHASGWNERLDALLTIMEIYLHDLFEQGVTRVDHLKPRHPSIGLNESLYDFAVEIYRCLPEALVWARFNEIERWEQVCKTVILDPGWKGAFDIEAPGEGA